MLKVVCLIEHTYIEVLIKLIRINESKQVYVLNECFK